MGAGGIPATRPSASWFPFLVDPVDFLQTIATMAFESPRPLDQDAHISEVFHTARGSESAQAATLPWLDAEKTVFIAVNRHIGDDVAIALDYRTDADDPRVVASEWQSGAGGCLWRPVTATFTQFARALKLDQDRSS
jgi:hypothetical protein